MDNSCNCAICLDTIDENNDRSKYVYSLPECNCTFHADCIISWFRQGHNSCPNCRNTGTINTERSNTGNRFFNQDIKLAKRFARKNPDHEINKYIKRISTKEDQKKKLTTQKQEISNSIGVFKKLKSQMCTIQRKIWHKNHEINKLKYMVNFLYPVINLIVVTKKVIRN